MPTIEELLDMIAIDPQGSIVSSAQYDHYMINQARASKRMYVDENGLGFIYIPSNQVMIERFEELFPLPIPKDVQQRLDEKLKDILGDNFKTSN